MDITDKTGGIIVDTPKSQEPRPVSLFDQININVFWLANQFHWNAIIAVIIPSMVAKLLDPTQKDINLPLVVIWGTLVAVVVTLLVALPSSEPRPPLALG